MRSKMRSIAVFDGARESSAPTHGCASTKSKTAMAIRWIALGGPPRGEEQLVFVRYEPVERAGARAGPSFFTAGSRKLPGRTMSPSHARDSRQGSDALQASDVLTRIRAVDDCAGQHRMISIATPAECFGSKAALDLVPIDRG